MVEYAIYGKIIVDTIRLLDGAIVRQVLGGGGPQGAFGARVWSNSVGLLTRSGAELEPECRRVLEGIDVDLEGWVQFPDIPTPHSVMAYDDKEYMLESPQIDIDLATLTRNLSVLLAQPIPVPPGYQQPRAIHLITEYADEPMVHSAFELKEKGAIFSLEPLIDYRQWTNRDSILELLKHVHTASPDWPSASGFAGSDDPLEVMKYWSKLGPDLVTVRHGSIGSYAWDKFHDRVWHIPPVPVEAVDPTGAGNSYSGGMCVGWVETQDGLQAGCYGAISASFVVATVGLPCMTAELQAQARSLLERTVETAKEL